MAKKLQQDTSRTSRRKSARELSRMALANEENCRAAGQAAAKKVVLVGTYRAGQLERWPGYYNYPLAAGDAVDAGAAKKVNEIWLFNGARDGRHFAAEFVGTFTRAELVRDWGYPAKGAAHGEKYLLYRIQPAYAPANTPDALAAETERVIVRAADFAKRSPKIARAIKAYLESSDHNAPGLAHRLPPILLQMPRAALCVCEPGVQMEFVDILDNVKELQRKMMDGCDGATMRFIDLFAGIGGIRKGFELACAAKGIKSRCVFTSEIKPHAIEVLRQNHPDEYIHGDITQVDAKSIPDFDVLLGGFPCQAFSAAGKRLGFEDTRGTLFFDVARIIKEKKPLGFVLENVEGLVNHDKKDVAAEHGKTLEVILATLAELGYKVTWRVLNASDFGVPQDRKRIYIVGAKCVTPDLNGFETRHATVGEVLEHGQPPVRSKFIDKLLAHYSVQELAGKAIKDKRGGSNNIHSWDFEYKGRVSARQRKLLNELLKERRKHQWAEEYGIDWMDGMPLTIDMIRTFFDDPHLEEMLEDLVAKRYVVKEHPKRKVKVGKVFVREQDPTLPLGYNIVAGKMSFEISKILSPDDIAPTLVAMDMQHLYVADGDGLRNLTLREGLSLFGYPKEFKFDVEKALGYDLLGNTVVVPVIQAVSDRLLKTIGKEK